MACVVLVCWSFCGSAGLVRNKTWPFPLVLEVSGDHSSGSWGAAAAITKWAGKKKKKKGLILHLL